MTREQEARELQSIDRKSFRSHKKNTPWGRQRRNAVQKSNPKLYLGHGTIYLGRHSEAFSLRLRAHLNQLNEAPSSGHLEIYSYGIQKRLFSKAFATEQKFEDLHDLEEPDDYLADLFPVSFDPEGVGSTGAPSSSSDSLPNAQEIEKLTALNKELSKKVDLLKADLRQNAPHLQLYRFGAGAVTLSSISLLSWLISGVSIPFHPVFVITTFPMGIAFMAMAWLTRKNASE